MLCKGASWSPRERSAQLPARPGQQDALGSTSALRQVLHLFLCLLTGANEVCATGVRPVFVAVQDAPLTVDATIASSSTSASGTRTSKAGECSRSPTGNAYDCLVELEAWHTPQMLQAGTGFADSHTRLSWNAVHACVFCHRSACGRTCCACSVCFTCRAMWQKGTTVTATRWSGLAKVSQELPSF